VVDDAFGLEAAASVFLGGMLMVGYGLDKIELEVVYKPDDRRNLSSTFFGK
jgi:hypothetical protein